MTPCDPRGQPSLTLVNIADMRGRRIQTQTGTDRHMQTQTGTDRRSRSPPRYLVGEPVLAGVQANILHGGAGDHHLGHVSAGHKHGAGSRAGRGGRGERGAGSAHHCALIPKCYS